MEDAAVDRLRGRCIILVEEKMEMRRVLETLNERNLELVGEMECLRDRVMLLEGQNEQLKLEVTKKYRIEERNEWRHLVESLQKDRQALQEENEELQARLTVLQDGGVSGAGDTAGGATAPASPRERCVATSSPCPRLREAQEEIERLRALISRQTGGVFVYSGEDGVNGDVGDSKAPAGRVAGLDDAYLEWLSPEARKRLGETGYVGAPILTV